LRTAGGKARIGYDLLPRGGSPAWSGCDGYCLAPFGSKSARAFSASVSSWPIKFPLEVFLRVLAIFSYPQKFRECAHEVDNAGLGLWSQECRSIVGHAGTR